MSLRIWLPLTKDLRNQGLDNVTVTNNGATFDSAGKLGGCYNFNGSSKYISITNPLKSTSEVSCAVWVKPSTNTSTNEQIMNIGTSSGWNNIRFGILQRSINQFIFHVSNGTNNITYSCASGTIPVDQWIHISCVYKNRELKMYLNGELVKTYSISFDPSFTGITNIGIGAAPNGSEKFTGYISDVRIYDHALSQMEVKELAKGLVLHYPLNRQGWGQENIIPNSKIDGSWTYPSSSYSDKYSTVTTVIPSATQYTLSFDAKSTVSGDKMRTHYYSPNTTTTCVSSQGVTKTASDGNMDFTLSTQWQRYWVTYTQTETTAVKHLICPRLVSGQGSGTVSVKNVKLEEGSIATPWCPNSSDTLATTMSLNSTTEYDCSGFCNNGEKIGNLTYTSNTPKYSVSTHITNGANTRIVTPSLSFPNNAVTLNIWFRSTNTSPTNNYHMVVDSVANRQWYEMCVNKDGFFRGGLFVNGTRYADNCTSTTALDGQWHMLTLSYDGSIIKRYYDGQLEKSTSVTASSGLSSPTALVLGRDGPNANYACKEAYLSDFRIYATALSANDVKSLYQNSAYIDSSGNIYGAIHEEV